MRVSSTTMDKRRVREGRQGKPAGAGTKPQTLNLENVETERKSAGGHHPDAFFGLLPCLLEIAGIMEQKGLIRAMNDCRSLHFKS